MKIISLFLSRAAGLFLSWFIVGNAAAAQAPATKAPDWEQVVAAAKKEGTIVVFAGPGGDIRESLVRWFQEKYPEINVDYEGAMPAQLASKIIAERRSGLYRIDVIVQGSPLHLDLLRPAGVLDPIDPYLVGPEIDPSKWKGGKFEFADDGKLSLVMQNGLVSLMGYNPKNLSGNEVKSWWDLLSPRWKGKMVMKDTRVPGAGSAVLTVWYTNPDIGTKFIKQLFEQQEVVISRDDRQIWDWIARGRYLLAIAPSSGLGEELRLKGMPIQYYDAHKLKESPAITSGFGNVAVANRAPHPNAIKVYLNWLLSREGQLAYSKALAWPSNRLDVPTDHIQQFMVPRQGVRYQAVHTEAAMKKLKEAREFIDTLIGK